MTRHLYRFWLVLLPRWFRAEYAGEMLWIFDQTPPCRRFPLVIDIARSVLGQRWGDASLFLFCGLLTGVPLSSGALALWVWRRVNNIAPGPPMSEATFASVAAIVTLMSTLLVSVTCVVWFRRTMRLRDPDSLRL